MFTFVQASSMKNDSVYRYSLQKSRAKFLQRYQQAVHLCAGEEFVTWTDYLTDDLELWKEIAHPVFIYWSDNRLMPSILQQDKVALQRENRQVARFFLLPLYKRGILVPQMEIELDDRGELKFPGYRRYLAFGAEHAYETVGIHLTEERVILTLAGRTWDLCSAELLGAVPATSSIVRQSEMSDATPIDWQMSDILIRQHIEINLQNKLSQVLKQNQTESLGLLLHETFTLADVWYYEKAMDVIQKYWPNMYEEVIAHMRMVVILDTEQLGGATSSTFPGGIFLSHRPNDLHWTIENLIHEFGHARLNQLFELDPLVLNDSTEGYSSPWRNDLRPLDGLVHGMYVFTRVALWYEILLEKTPDAQEVRDRLGVVLREVHAAAGILLANGEFTPIGKALLDEMIGIYTAMAERCGMDLEMETSVTK